jgi:iron complex transport system ATP-binding protein|uniref:ABC transporter ATP-binding protein n=1 Tax=Candidatus Planktophila sp. TaxID=2175601 RepID=UPI004048F900
MISIKSISVVRGTKLVIKDFSAEFKAGTITAIIGPNGCGKSTLLAAIAGDLPLTSGAISLNEKDLASYQIAELAKLRSVVLQQPAFNLAFTVKEVLAMARTAGSTLASENAAIAKLAISDLADRKVTQLSGGERQRVAIALAIAVGAPALLLDEPLAAQDVESTDRIIELLKAAAKAGKTIVLVAHVPESDLSWCDQIIKNF